MLLQQIHLHFLNSNFIKWLMRATYDDRKQFLFFLMKQIRPLTNRVASCKETKRISCKKKIKNLPFLNSIPVFVASPVHIYNLLPQDCGTKCET